MRAAAGADLDHVDHRQHHRMAAGIAADIVAGRHGRLAVAHQARLGGGAAHVEGDDVRRAERAPDPGRRDNAADRPGLHHRGRALGRDFGRHHAAVRAHDRERAAKSDRAQARIRGSSHSRRPSARDRRSPPWSTCARTRGTRAGFRATARRRRPALPRGPFRRRCARARDWRRSAGSRPRPPRRLRPRARGRLRRCRRGSTGACTSPDASSRSLTSRVRWRGTSGRWRWKKRL